MFKPYQLASIQVPVSTRRRIVEVISHPTPEDTIMIRWVPGEPTTTEEVQVKDLLPYQRKKYVHVAEVTSSFVFPEDMLRYDGAALYDHTVQEDPEEHRKSDKPVLVYHLTERKDPRWTIDRWLSFSAYVKHISTKKLGTI